jgi:hypothetical protein
MRISYAGNKAMATLALLGAVALGLDKAQAIPLEDLFGGGSIVVDDKRFDDWTLEFDRSSVPIDFAAIDVVGLQNDPITPELDPGLKFTTSDALTVTGGNFIDLAFDFSVTVLDPNLHIVDASLALTGFDFGAGSDGIIQIDDFAFTPDLQGLGSLHVEADPIFGNSLFDAITFPKQREVFEEINIFVDSGFSGALVGLTTFEVRKSQVPEPTSLALLAAIALAGFAVTKCRTR